MKDCKYLATYIVCEDSEKLSAYEVYKRGNSCIYSKANISSVDELLDDKSNIMKLLKMGNILQISSNEFGIKLQLGTLEDDNYTNTSIFNKVGEVEGDNIYRIMERLDNKMGDVVYSNKSNCQKLYGGLYGKRFNASSFGRRNG